MPANTMDKRVGKLQGDSSIESGWSSLVDDEEVVYVVSKRANLTRHIVYTKMKSLIW